MPIVLSSSEHTQLDDDLIEDRPNRLHPPPPPPPPPMSALRPPDVFHMTRPSPLFAALLLLCVIVNAN